MKEEVQMCDLMVIGFSESTQVREKPGGEEGAAVYSNKEALFSYLPSKGRVVPKRRQIIQLFSSFLLLVGK